MNNKSLLWSIVILIVLLVIGYWAVTRINQNPANTVTEQNNSGNQNIVTGTGEVKSFTVTGAPFSYSPNSLNVNRGDTVKITFTNSQGNHDLKIEGYNVGTQVIGAGQQEVIEFVANQTGSFRVYCSVPGHADRGMTGTLTVN